MQNKKHLRLDVEIFTQTSQRAFQRWEISFCRGAREIETSEVTFQGIYLVKEQRMEKSCPHLQSGLIHWTYHTAYTEYTVFFGCDRLQ